MRNIHNVTSLLISFVYQYIVKMSTYSEDTTVIKLLFNEKDGNEGYL